MQNPFDSSTHDNFPNFTNLFESSPTIDTIARTKPEFSLHNSVNSSRTATAGPQQHSPWADGAPRSVHSSLASQSPRHPRPRVAKQLNFSLPPSSREGGISRATAAAAGWPTHAVACSSAQQSGSCSDSSIRRGTPGTGGSASAGGATADDSIVAVPRATGGESGADEGAGVSVQTEGVGAEAHAMPTSVAPGSRSACRAAGSACSSEDVALPLPRPASCLGSAAGGARQAAARLAGMPRSPSAPVLRQSAAHPLPEDPTHESRAPAASSDAMPTAPFSERIEEVRRALLQPPTFEFKHYLRNLMQRWPQRPLARARLSELGLSPAKSRGAWGLAADAQAAAAGVAAERPPWRFTPPASASAPHLGQHMPSGTMPAGAIPMAAAMPMAPMPPPGMWPPYPYWPVPMPMPMPPTPYAYWGAPQPAWGAPQPSWPPPWAQSAQFQMPYYIPPMQNPMPGTWETPSWPNAAWPSAAPGNGAFSTATLPASRHLFKYVQ